MTVGDFVRYCAKRGIDSDRAIVKIARNGARWDVETPDLRLFLLPKKNSREETSYVPILTIQEPDRDWSDGHERAAKPLAAFTQIESDIIVIALRLLEDRVGNNAFDFSLEPEFENTSDRPEHRDLLGLLAWVSESSRVRTAH